MKKYTTEQINSIIENAVEKANRNIASNFANSFEYFNSVTEELPKFKGAELFFAAIVTSQATCANVLEDVLKKVLCD